jgi:hypothetical protein
VLEVLDSLEELLTLALLFFLSLPLSICISLVSCSATHCNDLIAPHPLPSVGFWEGLRTPFLRPRGARSGLRYCSGRSNGEVGNSTRVGTEVGTGGRGQLGGGPEGGGRVSVRRMRYGKTP